MNRNLSSEELAILAQGPQTLKRFICWRPLEIMAEFIVSGSGLIDEVNKSIYGMNVRECSDTSFIQPLNCLIKIGTSPGAQDVGIFRFRSAGSFVGDEGIIYVNETAYADVPIQDGMYGTLIRDHRVWERKIRRVQTGPIDYIEYLDFTIAYGGENDINYPPVVNVTRDAEGHPVEYMGFLEDGEDYRELDLSAVLSFDPAAHGELEFVWSSLDTFEIVDPYEATDVAIKIRIPAGFTEIKVAVTSPTFFAIYFIPLWAFTGPDDPLLITDFDVTKDSRKEGREMEFFVRDTKSNDYPEGQQIGYFEVAYFGDDPAPAQYVDQFLGWATQDSVGVRLYRPMWRLNVGGHQTFLDKISIGAQTVYDPRTPTNPTATPQRYIELPNATPDKMIHYFLRINTTALEVMNLYFSDYEEPIEGFTSSEGSVWSVMVAIAERYFGLCATDSVGATYLSRHYDYLEQVERDAIAAIININKSKWRDDAAPVFTEDKIDKIGKVDLYGANYDVSYDPYVNFSHIYRVLAPGIVPGKGPGKDAPPSRFLRTTNSAILQLRRWAGHHYARKNNKRSDIPLALLGDLDIAEPAWGLPITITHTDANSRNLSFTNKPFLIKSVEVAHSNKYPFKRVTWNLEQATIGYPGIAVDVTQKVDVDPYPTPDPSPLPPYEGDIFPGEYLIVFDSGETGKCHVMTNFNQPMVDDPEYIDVSAGLTGGNIWHSFNTSDGYVECLALQTTGLFTNPDVLDGGTWDLIATPVEIYGASDRIGGDLLMSINRGNWLIIPCGNNICTSPDKGVTWIRVNPFGLTGEDFEANFATTLSHQFAKVTVSTDNNPGAADEGWIYVGTRAGGHTVYKHLNWAEDSDWDIIGHPDTLLAAPVLNFPFTRVDGTTRNTNDANTELYATGRVAANVGRVCFTETDGLDDWPIIYNESFSGVNAPDAANTGHSIQTWTYGGNKYACAYMDTGAGSACGIMIFDYDTKIFEAELVTAGQNAEHNGWVQGFPLNSQAWLYGNRVFEYIFTTLADGADMQSIALPPGYSGAGSASWFIRQLFED